jgi:hypothetical protein
MVYPKFCVSSRYRLQVYTCFWIDKIKTPNKYKFRLGLQSTNCKLSQ